jgi:hypothetical protein
VISVPNAANRIPVPAGRISLAFAIPIIPVAHRIIVPIPIVIVLLNHKEIIISANNAISINAVCFDILARAKNTHDVIIYLLAFLSQSFVL